MWSWPGLQSLWQSGQVSGLIQATTFSLLLNLCLVTTCIWPGWIEPGLQRALWLGLCGYWGLSFWAAFRNHGNVTRSGDPGALFIKAQDEYLKGDWYGAERILRKLLRWQPQDAEARLMLATLLRHTMRLEEARLELRRLQKVAHAAYWHPELVREWQYLEKLSQQATEESTDAAPAARAA